MNKYLKTFLHRGLIFAGFGPVVAGIVFLILDLCGVEVVLSGTNIFSAIISTYVIAFVHSGSSVFHEIESFSPAKSMICQLSLIYAAYTSAYLINSWIPFNVSVILIYTAIFIVAYFLICLTVYLVTRRVTRKMNREIE